MAMVSSVPSVELVQPRLPGPVFPYSLLSHPSLCDHPHRRLRLFGWVGLKVDDLAWDVFATHNVKKDLLRGQLCIRLARRHQECMVLLKPDDVEIIMRKFVVPPEHFTERHKLHRKANVQGGGNLGQRV